MKSIKICCCYLRIFFCTNHALCNNFFANRWKIIAYFEIKLEKYSESRKVPCHEDKLSYPINLNFGVELKSKEIFGLFKNFLEKILKKLKQKFQNFTHTPWKNRTLVFFPGIDATAK
jgi:hypothetical protein